MKQKYIEPVSPMVDSIRESEQGDFSEKLTSEKPFPVQNVIVLLFAGAMTVLSFLAIF